MTPTKIDHKKSAEVREIFGYLYDLFQSKRGSTDRFANHPGFDKRTGPKKLTAWDRIAMMLDARNITPVTYVFITLKQLIEDDGAENVHPHFLLAEKYVYSYQKAYPMIVRDIEIEWQDQLLLFDAEAKQYEAMCPSEQKGMLEKMQYIFLMSSTKFSPLFRFYKAGLYGDAKLQEETEEEAKFEYIFFPQVFDSLIKKEKILKKLR